MMKELPWSVVVPFCILSFFIYYQQLHINYFRGSSQRAFYILAFSSFIGFFTGIVFLFYYGIKVIWWAPLILLAISILFKFITTCLEILFLGELARFIFSITGLLVWPICAIFLFINTPSNQIDNSYNLKSSSITIIIHEYNVYAIIIYMALAFLWWILYSSKISFGKGPLGFWLLASTYPDLFIDWCKTQTDWHVFLKNDDKLQIYQNNQEYCGPFSLLVPSLNNEFVTIYALRSTLEDTEENFLELVENNNLKPDFPVFSFLSMFYPILVMSIFGQPEMIIQTLGLRVINLGFLLLISAFVAKRFAFLGLYTGLKTTICAIILILIGFFFLSLNTSSQDDLRPKRDNNPEQEIIATI